MIEIRRDVVGELSSSDPKWKRLIEALNGMPVGS